jgi:hypothetical protein
MKRIILNGREAGYDTLENVKAKYPNARIYVAPFIIDIIFIQ